MNPKPPAPRTGRSGWLGHHAKRLKGLAVAGAVSLGFAGAGFAAAAPASADPGTVYVGVGSDTIQDVMNGFAFTTGGGTGGTIIASYNAVNPVDQTAGQVITPSKIVGSNQVNCQLGRPNGSGAGFNALDASFNQSTTLSQTAPEPGPGCVDFSRSSSGAGSVATGGPGALSATGNLVYIPFALDAVAGSTGPAAAVPGQTIRCKLANDANCTNINATTGVGTDTNYTVPATAITQADMFTSGTNNILNKLYNCVPGTVSPNDFVAVNGVNYFPNGDAPAGATNVNIDLYAPQSGSGTLKFWASKVGFSATAPPTCVHQTILSGPAATIIVEEHDGTAYASDANGYGPFSIAQWIAQSHGIDDRRHSAVLHNIDGVSPFNGTKLNTAFPFIREVFNVMQYGAVVNGGVAGVTFDPVLSGFFATTSSALCQNTFMINNFGFAVLPTTGGPTPDQCGATTSSLRVQETNTGPA
jgi:phosphate transport system substrate-binding protein